MSFVVTRRTECERFKTEEVIQESGRKATSRLARRSGSIGSIAMPTCVCAVPKKQTQPPLTCVHTKSIIVDSATNSCRVEHDCITAYVLKTPVLNTIAAVLNMTAYVPGSYMSA
jgi:hypothetical protein